MRYLDEDLYIDIDFGRGEGDPTHHRESGTFEIQVSEMNFNSWTTIFEGSFIKSNICQQLPIRFYINDFILKTDVVNLNDFVGLITQDYPKALYEYRVVATSEYGDTQTSESIKVYPAFRNPETLSQMPDDQYDQPMAIVRQPMVPHYPTNILGYYPSILIYRKNDAPALTSEEGLWFADSKGLIQIMLPSGYSDPIDLKNLRGCSYYRSIWWMYTQFYFEGVRKVLKEDGSGFDTIQTTEDIVNPKYVFVKFTNNRYVLEDAFILDECPRDFYLHWIDRYGGVQCQPLRQNYKQTQNYTRESTQNLNNETHDYLNNVQTTYTFNTDWISRQEMAVWESLMTSPMVCLIDTRANKSHRVLVTDKSFSQKTFDNTHTLFNMTFNVKLAKTQRIYL